mgnify:CR=1 FL=1
MNYANSLVDKIQGFAGDYKNLVFENDEVKTEISNLLKNKQGIFFITNHIGNVELMRTLLLSKVMEENLEHIETEEQKQQRKEKSRYEQRW